LKKHQAEFAEREAKRQIEKEKIEKEKKEK
jgi:hypothetical protein